MGLLDELIKNNSLQIRTTEEIDMLFSELEKQNQRIDKLLDFKIRMSIHKLKLQTYYESKLKDYKKKDLDVVVSNIPSSYKNTKGKTRKLKIEDLNGEVINIQKGSKEVEQQESSPDRLVWDKKITTREIIDFIVSYFTKNKSDFVADNERWIRQNISSPELLAYYKYEMLKVISKYQSVVNKMLEIRPKHGKSKIKRRVGQIIFLNKLTAYIEKGLNENQSNALIKGNDTTSFEFFKKREWILDWNCVLFRHGSAVIYSRSDLGVKFKPTTILAPDSTESFNYLKKYLNERLPPVRCYIVEQNLTVIDDINFSMAIQQFAVAARQGVIKVGGTSSRVRLSPEYMTFSQALSRAKQMTPEEFKKYKSEFIDFLVILQSKEYKVIPCVERLAHTNSDNTEYAFMFSTGCKSGKVLVIYENVNPDRSTLLFIVEESSYNKSIRAIYDFLQSAEINKRSSLREKDIEIDAANIIRYKSINHDSLDSWQRTIRFFKQY